MLRTHVYSKKFLKSVKNELEQDHLAQFAMSEIKGEIDIKGGFVSGEVVEDKLPWYLIDSDSVWIQTIETLMAIPIALILIVSPLSFALHGIVSFYEIN